jgi:hypothetical protein
VRSFDRKFQIQQNGRRIAKPLQWLVGALPLKSLMNRPYNSLLVLPSDQGPVPTAVRICDSEEARRWDAEIQPRIALDKKRADANWLWYRNYTWCRTIENLLKRDVVYAQYLLNGTDPITKTGGVLIPAGQAIYSLGYPFPGDKNKKCVFIWFLTATPKDILEEHQLPKVKMLNPLLDLAVQISVFTGHEGRIALHADPMGGERLIRSYLKVGLQNIDKSVKIGPLMSPRQNDGRYFKMSEEQALAFADNFNEYRLRG